MMRGSQLDAALALSVVRPLRRVARAMRGAVDAPRLCCPEFTVILRVHVPSSSYLKGLVATQPDPEVAARPDRSTLAVGSGSPKNRVAAGSSCSTAGSESRSCWEVAQPSRCSAE
jgi:hypothetical protein